MESNKQQFTERNGYSTGQIFFAVLGGALAGAGAALLLAPKSGRDVRTQIGGYLDVAKDKVTRVPLALKSAGHAASEALTDSNLRKHS